VCLCSLYGLHAGIAKIECTNFTYGFVIPFISSYLLWHQRAELKSIPVKPTLLAVIPLSLALCVALVGRGSRGSVHDEGVDDLSSWKFDLSILGKILGPCFPPPSP
jgi:hypothetical protein